MFSQKAGKGALRADACHVVLQRATTAYNLTAKLDDVTRILSDLKADFDASKLSTQRMPKDMRSESQHADWLTREEAAP